jgi:glutathione peroxidase
MGSIHQFKVESIDGETIDFADFAGKTMLVVNVASECGYTQQYAQLQDLHKNLGDRLAVVGFPCNDFGAQEPGSESEIRAFCTRRFGVDFPLAAKIQILGDNPHPLYRWLTQKSLNGVLDSTVSWNFQKYLLDPQGRLLAVFPPSADPVQIVMNYEL